MDPATPLGKVVVVFQVDALRVLVCVFFLGINAVAYRLVSAVLRKALVALDGDVDVV